MKTRQRAVVSTLALAMALGGSNVGWAQTGVDDSGPDFVCRDRFEKAFRRYTWVNAGVDGQDYWVVEHPDGKVGYFGANAQGQRVGAARAQNDEGAAFEYHLVEQHDPFGNRVVYEYARPAGSTRALLSRASWLFVDGSPTYTAEMLWP